MPKLKSLVIRRCDWLHGDQGVFYKINGKWTKGSLSSVLRSRQTQQMCCLGHLGKALGVPTQAMTEMTMPIALEPKYRKLYPATTKTLNLCAMLNDDSAMTDADREARLIVLFKKMGFKLSFTGRNSVRKARS